MEETERKIRLEEEERLGIEGMLKVIESSPEYSGCFELGKRFYVRYHPTPPSTVRELKEIVFMGVDLYLSQREGVWIHNNFAPKCISGKIFFEEYHRSRIEELVVEKRAEGRLGLKQIEIIAQTIAKEKRMSLFKDIVIGYLLAGEIIQERYGESRDEFVAEMDSIYSFESVEFPLQEGVERRKKVISKIDRVFKDMISELTPYYEAHVEALESGRQGDSIQKRVGYLFS